MNTGIPTPTGQDLKKLSDDQFHVSSIRAGHNLKEATLNTLKHLIENESRRFYSKYDCDSLHAYAVKHMKMDDPTASRHISAARLMAEIPEVEEKILSGTMQMTSLADAGVFFRKEARAGNKFDLASKREVLLELDLKSTRDAVRVLVSKSSQPEIHFREKLTPKTESITELTTYIDQETMDAIERAKEIWSHAMPHAKISDILKRAVLEAVDRDDPIKKAERSKARTENVNAREKSSPAPGWTSNDSPAQVKHKIWLRDQGRCTFVDVRTGECCESKHFIEEDHIVPKAMGGEYAVENLRLRCRAHNQRHAIEIFGADKMSQYLN